jgi:hypothetical protein
MGTVSATTPRSTRIEVPPRIGFSHRVDVVWRIRISGPGSVRPMCRRTAESRSTTAGRYISVSFSMMDHRTEARTSSGLSPGDRTTTTPPGTLMTSLFRCKVRSTDGGISSAEKTGGPSEFASSHAVASSIRVTTSSSGFRIRTRYLSAYVNATRTHTSMRASGRWENFHEE